MNEQISLFEELFKSESQRFAERICDEMNKLDTVYKGTFYIEKIELSLWDHINDKDKALWITIKSPLNDENNRFIQFKGDHQSQVNLYNAELLNDFLGRMSKDKDFSIMVTPWCIYVAYHKFERKKIKYD